MDFYGARNFEVPNMKLLFAGPILFLFFAMPANADPISLDVVFSLELCVSKADGTADCTFSDEPASRVILDNNGQFPSVWSREITSGEHDFTGVIGLVRYADGDRLIFRVVTNPNHAQGVPSQVSFKISDWKKLQEVLFEPEPFRLGTLIYQPRLIVWPSEEP